MQPHRPADALVMARRLALALVALLAVFATIGRTGVVGGLSVAAIGLLLVYGLPPLLRSLRRSRSSRVCWAVSLAISAVTIAPQMALAHYRHVLAAILRGIFWWGVLAGLLRLTIFLADYFRRRAGTSPSGLR